MFYYIVYKELLRHPLLLWSKPWIFILIEALDPFKPRDDYSKMDSLNVSEAQKAKLQIVADQLSQIYKTLARMRYLDAEWIIPGPHDISANFAAYRAHGLEDSIIYLYSVLPYIDREFSGQVDFYEGGEFIDFRDPACLAQSREPLYTDDEERERMKPWMTPLSMGGNDGVAIVYSAKTNRIWMRTSAYPGSVDPVIMSGNYDCAESETSGSGTDDEDNDEEDEDNTYSEDDARAATVVLRDINRWFLELKALPGCGEYSSPMWEKTVTKPLYERFDWPSQNFDGDAFLVALLRADAQANCSMSNNTLLDLQGIRHELKEYEDPSFWKYWEDRIHAQSNPEEQWQARYQFWFQERTRKNIQIRLRHALAKGIADTADEQRLASEVMELQGQLEQKRKYLAKVETEVSTLPADARTARLRRKQVLSDVDLCDKACKQARLEKENTSSGGSGDSSIPQDSNALSTEEESRQLQREMAEDTILDAKAFLETLPSDIKIARQEIEFRIRHSECRL